MVELELDGVHWLSLLPIGVQVPLPPSKGEETGVKRYGEERKKGGRVRMACGLHII